MSSGTVGAAISGALCRRRSIAISYGHFADSPPSLTPGRTNPLSKDELVVARNRALAYSVDIVRHLWHNWDESTALYSINVPLCDTLAQPETCWTRLWESTHSSVCRDTDRFTRRRQIAAQQACTSTLSQICPPRCARKLTRTSSRAPMCGRSVRAASASRHSQRRLCKRRFRPRPSHLMCSNAFSISYSPIEQRACASASRPHAPRFARGPRAHRDLRATCAGHQTVL